MVSRGASSRFELKLSREQKARWFAAASRARAPDTSSWVREVVDQTADALLGRDDVEPAAPTREQIRVSLSAMGALGPERADRLRARIQVLRRVPWRGR